MRAFLVNCPDCGRVRVRGADVRLLVVRPSSADDTPESTYVFTCPACSERVHLPAEDRVVHQLVAAGVTVTLLEGAHPALRRRTDAPKPPAHPEDPSAGRPLTYDDLLDFHFVLADDHWFDALARHDTPA